VSQAEDEAAFELLQRVLRGERDIPRDRGTAKLCRILTTMTSDTTITPDDCSVLFARRRRGTKYFRRLVPGAFVELMDRSELSSILGPLRITLPLERVRSAHVWVFPSNSSVVLRTRVRDEPADRIRIEAEPPACPPLEPPPEPRFLDSAGTRCAHCGVMANRHRWLHADALVCGACGRSFARPGSSTS
jgi:hypothetical protein